MNKWYIALLKNLFILKMSEKEAVAITFHRNALCCLQTRFGKSVHPQNLWLLFKSSRNSICFLKRRKSNNNRQNSAFLLAIWYSQFTCSLIFIPTPATKFQSCDKNVCSVDQTPSPLSDFKKGWSLETRLRLYPKL